MAPPNTLFPVPEREIFIIKEVTPGTPPASAGVVVPLKTFKPADKPMWLDDESWQGNMGDRQDRYQGPLISSLDGGGDIFADTLGHFLYNLLGDYTASGTAATPASTSSAPIAVGATSITVASGGASFTAGMNLWIEDAGTPALNEVVTVVSSTATTITTSAFRFPHSTATPFTNTTAPYTHVFALLNGLVGAANGNGQPPTHTITDRTGIQATGLAAQYSYCCVSEVMVTGNAEKLTGWSFKTVNQVRTIPGSALAIGTPSAVQPYPSWRAVQGIAGPASGGTQVKDIGEFEFTLTRAVKPYFTNQGSQQPYVIARGKQGATGKQQFTPAIDESPYLAMIANTQPQLQVVASNGLSGVNLVSLQIDMGLAAYETADLIDGDELFGWDAPFAGVHTNASFGGITMTGASGGKGAIKVTLQNAIPTY